MYAKQQVGTLEKENNKVMFFTPKKQQEEEEMGEGEGKMEVIIVHFSHFSAFLGQPLRF